MNDPIINSYGLAINSQDFVVEGKIYGIKNGLIFKTHSSKYVLIYLSPVFVLLLLLVLQGWTESNFTW